MEVFDGGKDGDPYSTFDFGGFMVQPVDWGGREACLRSYELLARYVMPVFQGSLAGLAASQADVAAKSKAHQELRAAAVAKAEADYKGNG